MAALLAELRARRRWSCMFSHNCGLHNYRLQVMLEPLSSSVKTRAAAGSLLRSAKKNVNSRTVIFRRTDFQTDAVWPKLPKMIILTTQFCTKWLKSYFLRPGSESLSLYMHVGHFHISNSILHGKLIQSSLPFCQPFLGFCIANCVCKILSGLWIAFFNVHSHMHTESAILFLQVF